MRKYNSIERYGKRGTHDVLESGGYIVIFEKLDGANSSIQFVDGEIKCFSRNTELNETETLRGFYNWATDHFSNCIREEGLILYGEWLCPHKLDYGDNKNKFYLFDVYDSDKEEYLGLADIRLIARDYDLLMAPVFYEGAFRSTEHVLSFVGKSELGEIGEGVVVKNYTHRNRFGEQSFVKFVSDAFAEKAKTKKHTVKNSNDPLTEFIVSTLTEARVSKLIHKLVDENKLNEDYAIEDMGTILKGLGSSVFDDIVKEELDELLKVLKQRVGKNVPNVVKKVLVNEGRM